MKLAKTNHRFCWNHMVWSYLRSDGRWWYHEHGMWFLLVDEEEA